MKFHVGDRVESLIDESHRGGVSLGDIGTVVGYGGIVSVSWDRKLKFGHSCMGKAQDHHGWNVSEDNLLLIDESPEVEIDPIDLSFII